LSGEFVKDFDTLKPSVFADDDIDYPTIRVSYHPGYSSLRWLLSETERLRKGGFNIGVYAVNVPGQEIELAQVGEFFRSKDVPFVLKEYLDEVHGTYNDPLSVAGERLGVNVRCRPNELIIAPDLKIYGCASFMLRKLGGKKVFQDKFEVCEDYGLCSPCDQKRKRDRNGNEGYTSVETLPLDI
jgi:hypothetical protein